MIYLEEVFLCCIYSDSSKGNESAKLGIGLGKKINEIILELTCSSLFNERFRHFGKYLMPCILLSFDPSIYYLFQLLVVLLFNGAVQGSLILESIINLENNININR